MDSDDEVSDTLEAMNMSEPSSTLLSSASRDRWPRPRGESTPSGAFPLCAKPSRADRRRASEAVPVRQVMSNDLEGRRPRCFSMSYADLGLVGSLFAVSSHMGYHV